MLIIVIHFIAPVCFTTTYCGGQKVTDDLLTFYECCIVFSGMSYFSSGRCFMCPKGMYICTYVCTLMYYVCTCICTYCSYTLITIHIVVWYRFIAMCCTASDTLWKLIICHALKS